jgi:hypothetical protein
VSHHAFLASQVPNVNSKTKNASNILHDSATQIASVDQGLSQLKNVVVDRNQAEEDRQNKLHDNVNQLKDQCSSIQQILTVQSAISSVQGTQIVDMLRQLQKQLLSGPARPEQPLSTPSREEVTNPRVSNLLPSDTTGDLRAAVERLCGLVGEDGYILNSDEAEDVVGAIDRVIEHLTASVVLETQDNDPRRNYQDQ